jgi:DNA-directed RNA polymerase subunit beta
MEFELASGNVLSVKIDNRKKIPVTLMLRAFGIETTDELLKLFDAKEVERDLVDDDVRGMLLAESYRLEEFRRGSGRNSKEHEADERKP